MSHASFVRRMRAPAGGAYPARSRPIRRLDEGPSPAASVGDAGALVLSGARPPIDWCAPSDVNASFSAHQSPWGLAARPFDPRGPRPVLVGGE